MLAKKKKKVSDFLDLLLDGPKYWLNGRIFRQMPTPHICGGPPHPLIPHLARSLVKTNVCLQLIIVWREEFFIQSAVAIRGAEESKEATLPIKIAPSKNSSVLNTSGVRVVAVHG